MSRRCCLCLCACSNSLILLPSLAEQHEGPVVRIYRCVHVRCTCTVWSSPVAELRLCPVVTSGSQFSWLLVPGYKPPRPHLTHMSPSTCSQSWLRLPSSSQPPDSHSWRGALTQSGALQATHLLLPGNCFCSLAGPAWSLLAVRHSHWLQVLQHELMGLCDQRALASGWRFSHPGLYRCSTGADAADL